MIRDNLPAPIQPPSPTHSPQQPTVGVTVPTATLQGAAQGAARSITARMVDKFLSHPPDWLKTLWNMLPHPWKH
ncbi:hypothetical protein [Streptomyces sp. NPDC001480]|uniref:hypothetical protein n=1 Tax=Streptomyces sp. NPDC001480 TaxID=3364577 RepID=UPI0036A14F9D